MSFVSSVTSGVSAVGSAVDDAGEKIVDVVHDTVEDHGAARTISTVSSILGGALMLTGVGAPVGGALVALGAGLSLSQDLPKLVKDPGKIGNWAAVGLDALGVIGGATAALAPLAAARHGAAAVKSGSLLARASGSRLGAAAEALQGANTWAMSRQVASLGSRNLTVGHALGTTGAGLASHGIVRTGIRAARGEATPLEMASALASGVFVAATIGNAVKAHGSSEQQAAGDLASDIHEEWREPRRIEGTDRYEPRIKATTDEAWSRRNGGSTELDIANTRYRDLPDDWQAESLASSKAATSQVGHAQRVGRTIDDAFIERASSKVHDRWLDRNGAWAPPEQRLPYERLSAAEQAKDRVIVKAAAKRMEASP